jgi:CDP-diacylglycerol--glycerol-3-phosphate 3-phosphatidyltransferase
VTPVAPDPALPQPSARLVNLPNALTVLRLAAVPVFAVLLLRDGGQDDAGRWWAALTFGLAILTDRYDGMIARRTGQITEFGKLADPIADKALTGMALIGLSIIGFLPWWVTVVILARELGITLLRVWVIRHGVMAASRGGKLKTVAQSAAILLYLLPLSGLLASARWWVMAAAVVLTVATGIDYVYRALALRRAGAAGEGGGEPGARAADPNPAPGQHRRVSERHVA